MPAIKLKKVTAEYLAEKEREAEKSKLKGKKNLEDVVDEDKDKEEGVEEEEVKPHNFLDVEVLWEKRKRTLPIAEQKLIEWLDSNLEQREDVYLSAKYLYEYYCVVCQMQDCKVVDVPIFNKYIKEKFGKFYGFQENSPYKALIKERKVKEKKPKVQGETLQVKIRDILTEVLTDAGNPRIGIRFSHISKAIMQKYPAQRVDIYPKKLKMALERGVMYGYLERVRGVGMCGLYRLPGEPTKEEKDDKKDKVKLEDTENGKKEDGEKSGEADTTDDEEQTTKDTSAAESGGEKVKEESDGSAEKKKKKKKNRKLDEKWLSKAARHSAPKTVEDALPLAITYQTDPKESSGLRIKRYIDKFYGTDINVEKLKRALDHGVDKGLWEKTKGMGLNGIYHLLIESFNPSHSEDIQDQIAQALVANTVPKQASAGLIKKYITQYHPKLNIENRPKLYRNALEKACTKGIIRQLSGIGATGSFQLLQNFVPSPAILAGESEDEEEEANSDSDDEPEYVPRQTKRGRAAATKPRAKSVTSSAPARKAPAKRSSSASLAKAKKDGKQIKKEPEANNVGSVEYTPKPTKSRGGGKEDKKSVPKAAAKSTTKSVKSKKQTPAKPAKKQESAPKSDSKRSKRISYAEASDDEEEGYIPAPSRSRGVNSSVETGGSASASKQGSSKSKQAGKRKLMDESVEEDVAPSPSKKKVKEEVDVTPPKKAAPSKEKGRKRQR